MNIIAVIAHKGGTGKTTLALSLAVEAQLAGHNTLVVDLDPQTSALNWSARRNNDSPTIIESTASDLPAALAKAKQNDVDFVVIDTPAGAHPATSAAAKAASWAIIPCRPQVYDFESIPLTLQNLGLAKALVVMNNVPLRRNRYHDAIKVINNFNVLICPYTVGYRLSFSDAAFCGQTVHEFQPRGKARREIGTVYKHLVMLMKSVDSRRKYLSMLHDAQR